MPARATQTPAPATVARPGRVALVAVVAAALLLPSCKSRHKAAQPEPPTASPVVRGADRGLEAWWWIVTDPRIALPPEPEAGIDPATQPPPAFSIIDDRVNIETLLAPYLDRPVPLSDEMRQRWLESGFRIVSVPPADLERIQASSRMIGQAQRQWLGEVTQWADTVRCPTLTQPKTVLIGDEPVKLAPGRLRLMVRCWTIPISETPDGARPALQIELAPRLDPTVSERERMLAAAGMTAQSEAQFFKSLAATMTVDREETLVIIADSPASDWSAPGPAAPAPSEDDTFGPKPGSTPTLGEVMLSSPGSKGTPRARLVVVLFPRLPSRFELLPR